MAKEIDSIDENKNKTQPINQNRRLLSPKWRRILKYLIVFICVFGLVFQVTQLVLQYLERRTIVNVEFETLWYNRVPAITVCYPQIVAMNKTAEKFPHLRPAFKEYQNLLKNVSDIDIYNRSLSNRIDNLYDKKFFDIIHQNNISFGQLIELSIPFEYNYMKPLDISQMKDPEKVYTGVVPLAEDVDFSPIDVEVSGLNRHKNGSIREIHFGDKTPVESIVIGAGPQVAKCFTFFSHLQKRMRFYQMNIKECHLTIRHHKDWFPPTIYRHPRQKLLFTMHSPDTFPLNWDTFLELETDWFYEIRYNRWKTILLKSPYSTKCIDYNLDGTKGYKLRSDCINHCITKEIDKKCFDCDHTKNKSQCHKCFFRSDQLWRLETLKIHQDVKRPLCPDIVDEEKDRTPLDKCIVRNLKKTSIECQLLCPHECYNRYYNFNILSKERLSPEIKDQSSIWDIETKIMIGHNHMPDQTTKHIPEMTFTNFAGNFGGLFGVWMGLSAFAILSYLLKLI